MPHSYDLMAKIIFVLDAELYHPCSVRKISIFSIPNMLNQTFGFAYSKGKDQPQSRYMYQRDLAALMQVSKSLSKLASFPN